MGSGVGTLPGVATRGSLTGASGLGGHIVHHHNSGLGGYSSGLGGQIPSVIGASGTTGVTGVVLSATQKRERTTLPSDRIALPSDRNTLPNERTAVSDRNTVSERIAMPAASSLPERRSYSSKFDIYQDKGNNGEKGNNIEKGNSWERGDKGEKEEKGTKNINNNNQHHLIGKPKDPLIASSKGMGAHRTNEQNALKTVISSSSNPSNPSKTDSAYRPDSGLVEVDVLETEFEWFRLGHGQAAGQAAGTFRHIRMFACPFYRFAMSCSPFLLPLLM